MKEFEEIEEVMGEMNVMSLDDGEAIDDRELEPITITSTDPIEQLTNRVNVLINENSEMKRRIANLEQTVRSHSSFATASRPRRTAVPHTTELFKDKAPSPHPARVSNLPISASSDAGSSSIYNFVKREMPVNVFEQMTSDVSPRGVVTKSSSATAPMGYAGKKQVWGMALASMLIASVRYYIAKKKDNMIRLDESMVLRSCTASVGSLYSMVMHRELPGTRDPATLYAARSFERLDKNDIIVTNAETWTEMSKCQDGKDVLHVMNAVIIAAAQVPEVIAHPVSQIIPYLVKPVTRVHNGKSVFAMAANASIEMSPNTWETWCSILKESALTTYIKYRMSGMKQPEVVAKMVSEIRSIDLVEKKNMDMISNMIPLTMTHPSNKKDAVDMKSEAGDD